MNNQLFWMYDSYFKWLQPSAFPSLTFLKYPLVLCSDPSPNIQTHFAICYILSAISIHNKTKIWHINFREYCWKTYNNLDDFLFFFKNLGSHWYKIPFLFHKCSSWNVFCKPDNISCFLNSSWHLVFLQSLLYLYTLGGGLMFGAAVITDISLQTADEFSHPLHGRIILWFPHSPLQSKRLLATHTKKLRELRKGGEFGVGGFW